MAAGRVSPEANFSWFGDNFFEDYVSSLLSVGLGVMESVDKSAENFDLANIPKELCLFDDGVMAEWIGDEVPAAKKRKAMSYVTSRFGELKTMSKGPFVPKSTGVEGQGLQLCCRRVSIFYLLCEILLYHRVSNHSLRVTGATRMWEANVPEKLIEEKTGYCSLEALKIYEHPLHMQRAVSGILASSEDTDYQSEVSNKGQILPVSSIFTIIHPAPISDTSAATRGELFGKVFIHVKIVQFVSM